MKLLLFTTTKISEIIIFKTASIWSSDIPIIILKYFDFPPKVRDAGANVIHHSCKNLAEMSKLEKLDVDFVFTDFSSSVMRRECFQQFVKKRKNLGKPIGIKSYLMIFKKLSMEYQTEREKLVMSNVFDITNEIYLKKIHPENRKSITDFLNFLYL